MACECRDIFGRAREGVHSVRLFDVAVVDAALALAGAFALSTALGWNFGCAALVVLLAGIAAHRLFCVNTALNVALFGYV